MIKLSSILLSSVVLASVLMGNEEKLFDNVKRDEANAVLLVLDNGGLNGDCRDLMKQNVKSLGDYLSDDLLNSGRVKRVDTLVMNDKVSVEDSYSSKGAKQIRRRLEWVTEQLKGVDIDPNAPKDVYGAMDFASKYARSNLSGNDHVAVIVLSNLRHTLASKKGNSWLKEADKIKFPGNVSLIRIYAKSGLQECKNATASQALSSETNACDFWSSKIVGKKVECIIAY